MTSSVVVDVAVVVVAVVVMDADAPRVVVVVVVVVAVVVAVAVAIAVSGVELPLLPLSLTCLNSVGGFLIIFPTDDSNDECHHETVGVGEDEESALEEGKCETLFFFCSSINSMVELNPPPPSPSLCTMKIKEN